MDLRTENMKLKEENQRIARSLSEMRGRWETAVQENGGLKYENDNLRDSLAGIQESHQTLQTEHSTLAERAAGMELEINQSNRDKAVHTVSKEQFSDPDYLTSLGYSNVSEAIRTGRLTVKQDDSRPTPTQGRGAHTGVCLHRSQLDQVGFMSGVMRNLKTDSEGIQQMISEGRISVID